MVILRHRALFIIEWCCKQDNYERDIYGFKL